MSFGKLGALGSRGGFGFGGALGGAGKSGPAAPALTWNSTSSDTTPDFLVDLPSGNGPPKDAVAGDNLILEYQPQAGGSWTQYLSHTLTSGDISADIITLSSVTPVANGSYFFRGRLERETLIGANSSSVAVTINAVTNRLMWSTDQQLWSTDHLTWA